MGKSYTHITLKERAQIDLLKREGLSNGQIGARLGRPRQTIWREVKRNSKPTKAWKGGYEGERAHGLALRRRRWDARFKLARQPELRKHVRDRLAMGWSPEMVAGRLARDHGRTIISHESIYRYVHHRSAQKDYWHRLLPRAKFRRGHHPRRNSAPTKTIQRRTSITERPETAADRREAGHWEGDLMLFSRHGQAVLVTHERTSRLLLACRQPNKASAPVAAALLSQFEILPPTLRRSICFDNGTEFARHYELQDRLGMDTFFCDTHSPWQKGGVENAIGRLRRRLPRKTDLARMSPYELDNLIAIYNSTPRKCLGYRTPAEVFLDQLKRLHFNRESISPPAQG